MSPLVIGPLCLLFRDHIFADTKHRWAIGSFPSHLIADYFQLLRSRRALMDDWL